MIFMFAFVQILSPSLPDKAMVLGFGISCRKISCVGFETKTIHYFYVML